MIFKKLSKNLIFSLILIIFILTFDRITKIYVIFLNDKAFGAELFLSKFLNIFLVWNQGIAFGLFSFNQDYLYNLLTLFISIIIFVIFIMMIQSDGFKRYSLAMIFGGAIGNLYDRVVFKAVPDFIDFHISNFHWFIFNIADIFITLGVIFMILYELIANNKKHEKN